MSLENLKKKDEEIFTILEKERSRQEDSIELIASENIASQAVMEAQGSLLTNKYAEGYPRKRYYGGCDHVDEIEQLAIDRAKELFKAEHANVQPHSGSGANMAVYLSELKPGDKILGMNLAEGGHLTHGSPVSFSGKLFQASFYGVNSETGYIDYDEVLEIAKKWQPKMIIAGASSYSRLLDFKKFREISDAVGAKLLADIAHIAGLVAAGLHPSPIPYADYVTTTTHKTLRGPRGGLILTTKENAKKINSAIFPGTQGGPLEHVIAAKAIAFKLAMEDDFKVYQQRVIDNARSLASALVAKDFNLISGGTDNHLMLVNLINKKVTGKKLEKALDKANITLNKNAVPNDPESPFVTSGVRIGSPAVTSRGMGKKEMEMIVEWIDKVTKATDNEDLLSDIKKEVKSLCDGFPIYF